MAGFSAKAMSALSDGDREIIERHRADQKDFPKAPKGGVYAPLYTRDGDRR